MMLIAFLVGVSCGVLLERDLPSGTRRFDSKSILIYNLGMNDTYTQMRIWRTTLQALRRIYAETGESMIAIVDRLAMQELRRLDREPKDLQIQALPLQEE